jgi:hypothetical protein
MTATGKRARITNSACYKFAALSLDERCRTPRHPKGQLEQNVLAYLTGGGDFWGTRLHIRHHFREHPGSVIIPMPIFPM